MSQLVSASPEGAEFADAYRQRCVHPEHALAVHRDLLHIEAARQVASLFSMLSDPTRLQVVYALLNAPNGELCVGDLAAGLGRDDTTISHQLRVLRNHHIVAVRKVGRLVYYRLIDEHIRQVLALGLTHAREPMPASLQSLQEMSE
ncbi:MAG TPA: metalloregulator ArsR/SmtB family transcription factor [Ktedonobacteraceae bacterium]|nr:metalloregulator ArsR/SmtB family transcription factor [Ktedonobacteraceae bacterium]